MKVKALEAAEAARRAAEQKELEKQERKKAAELAKREKLERAAQDKLAKKEKAAQEKLLHQEARAEESNKRKAVAAGTTKSILVDSATCKGSSNQNMLVKVSENNLFWTETFIFTTHDYSKLQINFVPSILESSYSTIFRFDSGVVV